MCFSASRRTYFAAERARNLPSDSSSSCQTRRRSLPPTPGPGAGTRDLELLAAERLEEIRKLEQSAMEHGRQMKDLVAERDQLVARVQALTGEVDRMSAELDRVKVQAGPSSPAVASSRRSSPVHSEVITELRQLLQSNQVSTSVQGPDLQNILRQSYDYLTIMPKLRSTYDEYLIYKTSYDGRKAFLTYELAKL